MSLSALIRENEEKLVREWAEYARANVDVAATLPAVELEDSTRKLYGAISDDIETSQTSGEKHEKSWGNRQPESSAIAKYSIEHATHRVAQGFSIRDLISEFRAARASVMRLWAHERAESKVSAAEVERFNEALDEAISVSVAHFDGKVERSRDLFLGVLGHDMRSPLSAIMMLSTLLLRDEALSPTSAESARRIRSSGSRLTQMLDDLLDFTRTRLGRTLPAKLREGNLGETVSQVVDELRAHHSDVTFNFEATGDLHGRWDFDRLAQVVSNLGGNAVQHGDRTRPVDIRLSGTGDPIVLTVHNCGVPIKPAVLARIFDPLTRGQESQKNERGSVGLGLYICEQIAVAHGGSIEVVSNDSGTTFKVLIPR